MSFLIENPVLIIHVICEEAYSVAGRKSDIVMIPFTGTAESPYFNGKIIGTGVDTQKISKEGHAFLSARYMLEGKDCDNCNCRIFVENQGDDMNCCTPKVVTDSKVLAWLEDTPLKAVVEPSEGGVTVTIYKENGSWQ